jgi:hypothetical protein
MDFAYYYAVAVGSILILFLGWNLAAVTAAQRHEAAVWIRRQLHRRVSLSKQRYAQVQLSLRSVAEWLLLSGVNATFCVLKTKSLPHIRVRLGQIALFNLLLLFLGGRTGFVVHHVLGLSLRSHTSLHMRIGWIFILESLLHVTTSVWFTKRWPLKLLENAVCMC